MKKMSIFKLVRDPQNHSKIIRKDTLRVVNVSDSFNGIGAKGEINKEEFKSLANFLEPGNDGITIS